MAGKTFPGIGDLEDESIDPANAEDSGGTPTPSGQVYSGPTVVDDAKVEEGLKKLRSLDAPLEAIGAIDTAPELVESGGHQMPGYLAPGTTKDGGRGTFIGHSIAEPLPQPPAAETPYDDRMRGTLFGHMLHLPDLKLPAPEEPSTRELAVIDRSAPTSHAVEIYEPEPSQRAAAGIPFEAQAFPLSDRNRSIPIDLDAAPRNRVLVRVGIAAAAIAAIVGAAIIWLHTSTEEPEQAPRPAAVAQPAPPPAPAPVVVPTTPLPAPSATAPAPPPPAAAPAAAAEAQRPARDTPQPAERVRTLSVRPSTTPPVAPAARPERHRASAEPGETPAPPPPRPKASKKAAPEDDPDGTLAPTIE